jgi:hypothetical protein
MDIKEYVEAVKQEESLKIERNSRGVNWEFKLLGKVEGLITRAKQIDENLKLTFNTQLNSKGGENNVKD